MINQAMAPKKSHTAAAFKLDKEATQGFCAHSNNVVSLHTPTLADFTGFSEDLLRVLRSHFKHTEFNPSTLPPLDDDSIDRPNYGAHQGW